MARLEAKQNLGYIRLDPDLIPLIHSNLECSGSLFLGDPFCGMGGALSELAARMPDATTIGNELDRERYEAALEALDHTTHGPAEFLKNKNESRVGFLLYNPPYDVVDGKRFEMQFLEVSYSLMDSRGLILAVIPEYVARSKEWIEEFSKFFRHEETRVVPDSIKNPYRQALVFGRKKENRHASSHYAAETLYNLYEKEGIKPLKKKEFSMRIPTGYTRPIWENGMPDGQELMTLLAEQDILDSEIWRKNTIPLERSSIELLDSPGDGHIGSMIAAGMLDGVMLDLSPMPKDGQKPPNVHALVKGYTYKELDHVERTKVVKGEKVSYWENIERIYNRITVLNMKTGKMGTLDSRTQDEAYIAFLTKHIDVFKAYIKANYRPSFNGDTSHLADWFEKMNFTKTLKGRDKPGFHPEQERVNAALLHGFTVQKRKGLILIGEPGVGKSAMSIMVAIKASVPVAAKMQQFTVVMSPNHLVKKWKREVDTVLKNVNGKAFICTTPTAVDEAFSYTDGPSFLILSYSAAKYNAIWTSALSSKLIHDWEDKWLDPPDRISCPHCAAEDETHSGRCTQCERYIHSPGMTKTRVPSSVRVYLCPECGDTLDGTTHMQVKETKGKSALKNRMKCEKCGSPFWTEQPHVSKGKLLRYPPGKGFATIHGKIHAPTGTKYGGRRALAEYINRRYSNRFFLIVDEAHNAKGFTDIGYATQQLASASTQLLLMTGTFYGGKASSVFRLAYYAFPWFREVFEHSDTIRFIDQYGLRSSTSEQKLKYETSTYGYQRLLGQNRTEVSGTHPSLVSMFLGNTVYIYQDDMAGSMVEFKQYQLPIAADPESKAWAAYKRTIMGSLYDWAKSNQRDYPGALGAWKQAAMGYLNAPEYGEEFPDYGGYTIEPYSEGNGHASYKDQAILKIAKHEVFEEDRGILGYFYQTRRRDAMPRLWNLFTEAKIPTAILRSEQQPSLFPDGKTRKVKSPDREEFMLECVDHGAKAFFCFPGLVATGLDMLHFPTVILNSLDYNLYVLLQAIKRPHRIIQDKEVRVIYAYWTDSEEQKAVTEMAKKVSAHQKFGGRAIAGLAAQAGEYDAHSVLVNASIGAARPSLPYYPHIGDYPGMPKNIPLEVVEEIIEEIATLADGEIIEAVPEAVIPEVEMPVPVADGEWNNHRKYVQASIWS